MTEVKPTPGIGDRTEQKAIARRAAVMRYYLRGMTPTQIADKLHTDAQTVKVALAHAMRERREEHAMLADFSMIQMLDQLDQLFAAHFTSALKDHKVAEFILRVLDRKAKLLGLDAPQQLQVSVRSQIDDELERLVLMLRNKALEEGVEVDTPALDAAMGIVDRRTGDQPPAE